MHEKIQRSLWLLLIPVSVLIVSQTSSQQMIANITEDVETEFGTYRPCFVEMVPNAEPYIVEPDFSNVANISDFTFSTIFSSKTIVVIAHPCL